MPHSPRYTYGPRRLSEGGRDLSRRDFLKIAGLWTVGAGAAAISGGAYARGLEPDWVQVNPVNLVLPRLAPEFHGYRVAQVSDIHMSDWMNPARLADVVRLTNEQAPDLVAITGDFVTRNAPFYEEGLVSVLGTLRAKDGVVGVLGNHDHSSGASTIRRVMARSGIVELSNAVRTLRRGSALFHLAGMDDIWAGAGRLDQVLARLPSRGAALLLAHEPDFADASAGTGRFDLQISGHSHGGQVVVPFHGPLRLPPMGRKYPEGLYRVGRMFHYTNRGVGMVRPYVRFNCRPEITIFTLGSPLGSG